MPADPGDLRSPVALLVDSQMNEPAGGKVAARFSAADWGRAWEDALSRYGPLPARIELSGSEIGARLAGRRVIVVTRSAAARADDSTIAALGRWVERGGTLALELPDRRWAPCVAAWAAGDPRPVSLARSPLAELEPLAAPAESLPVLVPAAPLQVSQSCDTLLVLAGTPAAVMAARGQGRVLVLGFDLGRWLVSLQQGVPAEDFTVRRDSPGGGEPDILQTDDLVAAPSPPRRLIPWADRLQQVLIGRLMAGAGVARWRLLPHAARGIYLCSHDEEGVGDRWLFYAPHELRNGWPATWFVVPHGRITPAGYSELSRGRLEVGAHPDLRPQPRRFRWWAFWRTLPRRRADLATEVESVRAALRRLSGGPELRLNRLHYLEWSSGYADRFLVLVRHGIRLDSSYGPDRGGFGYVFGTGLPFRPLDANGHPLPIWEAPLQAQDDREFEPAEVLSLFHHGEGSGIGLIFHTTSMSSRPKASRLDIYLSAPEWARRAGFETMTYGELLDFWEARRTPFAQAWSGDTLVVRAVPKPPFSALVLQVPLYVGQAELATMQLGEGPWMPPPKGDLQAGGDWLDIPSAQAAAGARFLYRH